MVSREGVADPQFMHRGKTDAIGEGPLLVRVLAEERAGGMETLGTDPFKPEGLAAFDSVEKINRSRVAVADEKERDGLVHDVLGRQEAPAVAGELALEPNGGRVVLIARVPEGEKPRAIHEDVSGCHREYGQCPCASSCPWGSAWRGRRRQGRGHWLD